MNEDWVTTISQRECKHCLCKQDTGGNWYCCKCGWKLPYTTVFYPSQVSNFITYSITIKPVTKGSETIGGER